MARKSEKREKREIHNVGPGIWQENWKTRKMRNINSRTWIWRESWKLWKMRHKHCLTWNMAKKLKKVKNETRTLFDLESREKHSKTWTMRNTHLGTGK
jgi:hypothetical protein